MSSRVERPREVSSRRQDVQVEETHPVRLRIEAALEWVKNVALGRPVAWAVRWRYLTLGLAGLAFCLSAACLAGGLLKFRAFPDIEGDVLQARVLLPQGTPLERTEALCAELETSVREIAAGLPQPGGKPLIRHVSVRFNQNVDAYEQGPTSRRSPSTSSAPRSARPPSPSWSGAGASGSGAPPT